MQASVDCSDLESFDELYQEENNLFIDWFLGNHLEINKDDGYLDPINTEFNRLNVLLKEIPQTLFIEIFIQGTFLLLILIILELSIIKTQ